jgi:hypothetical protein
MDRTAAFDVAQALDLTTTGILVQLYLSRNVSILAECYFLSVRCAGAATAAA